MDRRPGPLTAAALPAIAAILAAALLAPGCGSSAGDASPAGGASAGSATPEEKPDEEAIPVRVAPVRRESIASLYTTSATLRADKRATVTARTRGVVEQIVVEEGNVVRAGQALAHLEKDEQEIAHERARTAHETRKRELERSRSLHDQGLVSEEAFETLRREAEDAEQAFALAELTLSRTIIRAPFTGVILTRHLDVGATVSDGTEIFDIADLDPLFADVNVPERHVARLAPGKPVRLTVDASEEAVPAAIDRIAPAVDPTTGTVKVTVRIPASSHLRPGSFARVNIVTDTHEGALVVPRPALVAEGSRWHLFRVNEAEATVEQLDVRLGFEEGERVEILEVVGEDGALEPGHPVVVVGAPALTDGARVDVMDAEEEEAGASS